MVDKDIESCIENMANDTIDPIGYDSTIVAKSLINSCKNCYIHFRGKWGSRTDYLDNFRQILAKTIKKIEKERTINKKEIQIINVYFKDYEIIQGELLSFKDAFMSFYKQFEALNKETIPADYVKHIVTLKRNFFDIMELYEHSDKELKTNKQKLITLVKSILNK